MKLNLYAPIGYTGYGMSGLNFLLELNKQNIDTALFLIGFQPFVENEEEHKTVYSSLQKQEFYDPKATCVKIWHQFDLGPRIGNGKYIAFPFFEITPLADKEIHHLRIPDELIVSSHWAKQVILEAGIYKPIHVVPLGVSSKIFDYSIIPDPSLKPSKYVFLNVGKWEIRKGHDVLIELFNEAFEENDDVELWVAGSSSEQAFSAVELQQWHSMYNSCKLKDKVKIFPRLKTQKEVAQLMSYADCGIFPSRAEGWNLELLEMMAMNKPVIATEYSAHTEFCNSNNCMLVDINETEKAYDGKYFFGSGNWAKIGKKQKDQMIEYMRKAYKDNNNTNTSGVETAKKYSWQNATSKLIGCI